MRDLEIASLVSKQKLILLILLSLFLTPDGLLVYGYQLNTTKAIRYAIHRFSKHIGEQITFQKRQIAPNCSAQVLEIVDTSCGPMQLPSSSSEDRSDLECGKISVHELFGFEDDPGATDEIVVLTRDQSSGELDSEPPIQNIEREISICIDDDNQTKISEESFAHGSFDMLIDARPHGITKIFGDLEEEKVPPEQAINLEPLAVASQPPADNRDARLPSSIKTSEDFFDIDQISPTQKYKDVCGFSVDMSAVQNAISSPSFHGDEFDEPEFRERDSIVQERIEFFEAVSSQPEENEEESSESSSGDENVADEEPQNVDLGDASAV